MRWGWVGKILRLENGNGGGGDLQSALVLRPPGGMPARL